MWERGMLSLETGDPLFVVNRQQRIVQWNRAAEALFGYPATEVAGTHCYDLFGCRSNGRRHRTNCVDRMRQDPAGRRSRHVQRQTKDGCVIWVSVSSVLLPSRQPDLDLLVHLVRDIGPEKERERFIETLAATAVRLAGAACPSVNSHPELTTREQQVLRLLSTGAATQQMAAALGISPATARNHIHHILGKLGATTRLQAVAIARRDGIPHR